MSLSIREMNYGDAMYAHADIIGLAPMIDILGQGDGRKVCRQWYARLRRTTERENCDLDMWPILSAASLLLLARKYHPKATDETTADLVAFVVERGMGLIERRAS
jgi:hypothetical protein